MADMAQIARAVEGGRRKVVDQLVREALAEGVKAETILNEGLVVGMTNLGEQFKNGEVYVPEVLVAARAMKTGTEILKPLLVAENVQSLGTVAIGTVEGDLHDIGKNLVGMMLEGSGFTVMDLGVDVKPEMFIDAGSRRREDHRHVRASDHHDAHDGQGHRAPEGRGPSRSGEGHDRRRAHHAGIRRRNRRGRLFYRRSFRGGTGQASDCVKRRRKPATGAGERFFPALPPFGRNAERKSMSARNLFIRRFRYAGRRNHRLRPGGRRRGHQRQAEKPLAGASGRGGGFPQAGKRAGNRQLSGLPGIGGAALGEAFHRHLDALGIADGAEIRGSRIFRWAIFTR